jgi:uncharacterized membrane protein
MRQFLRERVNDAWRMVSFTGELGKEWGRTKFSSVLPVECLDLDDLVESTEGFIETDTEGKVYFLNRIL